jgi:shikimate dehydrogenase
VSPAKASSVYALLGKPVARNPTQEMLRAAFAAASLDAEYVSLEVEPADLEEAILGVRALGFCGLHVTVPHKVAVVPLLDELAPTAHVSGAVNCVKREGASLIGDNTDGKGFIVSLQGLLDPAGSEAVVIGAGGAARAIAVELAFAGADRITIANRSAARARELAASIAARTGTACLGVELTAPWEPPHADVIVQATTVGMGNADARLPVRWRAAPAGAVAADVVIDPPRTAFLRDAAAAGYEPLDGLGMLVAQAEFGFRWWTGQDADTTAMRRALETELGLSPVVMPGDA